ncbi:glycosyltransferase family 2 protein [bacterium]|nr:glycosyltransferase family 2 protein [bacterium]
MSTVTLITPCFNGENHLDNYIKGLLSQTASNVEYIFINDGSTDNTKNIILSYKKDFLDKGWTFQYLEQENSGQASAINKGLQIMTGDYFSCIDSDDILMPNYFEKMSNYLSTNSDVDMVFPVAEIVKEKTLEHICYRSRKINQNLVDTIFEDVLLANENLPVFASFMIRTKTFEKLNPFKQIYQGLSGQNPQFILPIAYNGKVSYLDDCLIKIVFRENSDSHTNLKDKTYNWEYLYTETLKTIPNMPEYEKAYYFQKIKERFSLKRLKIIEREKYKRVSFNILGIKFKIKIPK